MLAFGQLPGLPQRFPSVRRSSPPWTIEENNNACFIVRDATGQALGYFYFDAECRSAARPPTG
jgi:hypothetical protein